MRISNIWLTVLTAYFVFGVYDSIDTIINYKDPYPDAPDHRYYGHSVGRIILGELLFLAVYLYFLRHLFFQITGRATVHDTHDFILWMKVYYGLYFLVGIFGLIVISLRESLDNSGTGNSISYWYHIIALVVLGIFLYKHRQKSGHSIEIEYTEYFTSHHSTKDNNKHR